MIDKTCFRTLLEKTVIIAFVCTLILSASVCECYWKKFLLACHCLLVTVNAGAKLHRKIICQHRRTNCFMCGLYGQIRVGIPVTHAYSVEDLLYKYGVDVHLQAHEHSYERMWPVYNLQVGCAVHWLFTFVLSCGLSVTCRLGVQCTDCSHLSCHVACL